MKQEELKVTSPEEYAIKSQQASAGESVGFLHKLKKTGAVVRLRHVNMEALAVTGALPMSLVKAATCAIEDEQQSDYEPTPEQVEEGNKTAIFMRQMVVENCLEPQIRYLEGLGVFFVHSHSDDNMQIDLRFRVDYDDFMEMFEVISGQEAADGLGKFRGNRKQRRASAVKSRSKTLRPESVVAAAEK